MNSSILLVLPWLAAGGVCSGAALPGGVSPDGLWVDAPGLQSTGPTNLWVNPPVFRSVALDHGGMRALLAAAPLEAAGAAPQIIWLPMPDGSFERFAISESPVMPPVLQAQFPDIRTYVGQGMDDVSATVRLDLTPAGFHAQVLSPRGAAYVDKHTRDAGIYASYWKEDHQRIADAFRCLVTGRERVALQDVAPAPQGRSIGGNLRTYRLACAADGEFTAFHGGTVSNGLAAIVTTVNRVTGIYETELGIRLSLVANNNLLIYTNSATDPYSNTNSDALLDENQTNLDAVIGDANYDIGHVVGTGGGGLAAQGVCETGFKAWGETGNPSPVGDSFDVDYVAHEMGHQFSANHTFNGSAGSCSGNRNAATAYEVGSGSTILAYAGICSGDNLQNNSHAYFHFASFEEIVAYTRTGAGSLCPVVTVITNVAPAVAALPVYVVPSGTPFVLTAVASDPNGDALTYCWEERDLGASQSLGAADNGSSPLMRSFPPVASPSRYFPALTNVLSNTTNIANRLPTTARTMNFRVTVRDNRAIGGGVSNADTSVTFATNTGPFTVTSFNSGGTFSGLVAVTWNVAGTTGTPVNCANVAITLSTNGGLDYPFVLAAAVPNNGTNIVALPAITSSLARIKVAAVSNIFFDVNNANFGIIPGSVMAVISAVSNAVLAENCSPGNGGVDPGETVTVNYALRNTGMGDTTNIIATPLTNASHSGISSSLTFGVLAPGGAAVSQAFTFTALGACGGAATNVFSISDGTNVLGTAVFVHPLGISANAFAENFDGVPAPALPANWTTTHTGSSSNWITTTASPDSAPNAAYTTNVAVTGVTELVSAPVAVNSAGAVLGFRHRYDLERGTTTLYDGGVLEVKIGAGAFADVISNGCVFAQNGYVAGTISADFQNPLAGRACWSGNSTGYVTTVVNLPASAAGQTVQFKWRCASDSSDSRSGWWIDGVALVDLACCANLAQADLALSMSRSPANVIATQQLVFVLSVTNRGGATAANITISNPIPASASAVSANASQGSCTTNAGVIVCSIGSLSSGATATATILLAAQNPAAQIAVLTNAAIANSSVNDPVVSNNSASATVVVFKDTVGDGVPDFWRLLHFGSATTTDAVSCATCDPDGDGFNNRSEFLADTIPTNAASYLRVTAFSADSITQQISFATSTGRIYALEFNTDLMTGIWPSATAFIYGPGGITNFTSTNAATPVFFRLKAALP